MPEQEGKWYVIHTFTGYENKVARDLKAIVDNRNLSDLIQDIKVPTQTVIKTKKDGTQVEKEEKKYTSYVFVKMVMNENTWYIVRNVKGCSGFLGPEGTPVPLSPEEARNLEFDSVEYRCDLEAGDAVTVIDGPLEGYSGKVESVDAQNNIVQASIEMFGRETRAEFTLDQLKKIEE